MEMSNGVFSLPQKLLFASETQLDIGITSEVIVI
jgi:hypothetical protein